MLVEQLGRAFGPARILPAAADRAAWGAAADAPEFARFRAGIFSDAQNAAETPLPTFPAERFMDFVRNGNRSRYEALYFERRARLETLLWAETLEYRGRWLDPIVNHLWAILEEATWCLPAHANCAPDPLPDFEIEEIDLFSAESSVTVAGALALLEPELARISPNLIRRTRRILTARAVSALETDRRYWWENGTNNWTAWIAANILNAAAVALADDAPRFRRLATRLAAAVERYLGAYPADGGCDEGPSYWTVSPGKLLLFLEQLHRGSCGAISLYGEPVLRRMFEYIADAHLSGDRFVPFADCPVHLPRLGGGLLHVAAGRTGSEKLETFARLWRREFPFTVLQRHATPLGTALELFWNGGTEPAGAAEPDGCTVYPALQAVFAHGSGFRAAFKAGHNAENHNHLDVGEFILDADGEPGVIDLGNCEYTRDTFSERRYNSSILNSAGHNPPVFDGVGQTPGGASRARDFQCVPIPGGFRASAELSGGYAGVPDLTGLRREIAADFASGTVTVTDSWTGRRPLAPTVVLWSPGGDAPLGPLRLETESAVSSETVDFADPALRASWGGTLWKTTVSASPATAGTLRMVFRRKNS